MILIIEDDHAFWSAGNRVQGRYRASLTNASSVSVRRNVFPGRSRFSLNLRFRLLGGSRPKLRCQPLSFCCVRRGAASRDSALARNRFAGDDPSWILAALRRWPN